MPSRRWHQKSHHGCAICKQRKIKCDETRPTCKNCSKQGRPCQYTSEAAVTAPFIGHSTSGNAPHYGLIDFQAEKQVQDQAIPTSPMIKRDSSNDSKPFDNSDEGVNDLKFQSLTPATLIDLELMHHYTRHTYLTISDFEYTLPTWQDAMPKEAIAHPFLMHGLLALSAFHIAAREPSKYKSYRDRGMQHYTLAITLYRGVLMTANQSNCHALFAFSSLGAIISFAVSSASRHSHNTIIQDIQDTFNMLRGIHTVVMVTRHWIQHGPMATILRAYVQKEYDLPAACNEYLQTLENRVQLGEKDEIRRNSYLEAIMVGRRALKNSAADPNDKTLAFTWPIMVPRQYIDALHEGQPLAIAILGLYGVILHDLRVYWWASDRGIRLIEAVNTTLDETWEDALRYPVSLMGLSPTPRSHSHPSTHIDTSAFPSPHTSPPVIKFEPTH